MNETMVQHVWSDIYLQVTDWTEVSSMLRVCVDMMTIHNNRRTHSNIHISLSRLEELQTVRDQLFFSGFSSEVKPLSSERTGSEWQRPAGLRSEGAVWFSTESNLSTGDSEVSSLTDFCRSHIYKTAFIHNLFSFNLIWHNSSSYITWIHSLINLWHFKYSATC